MLVCMLSHDNCVISDGMIYVGIEIICKFNISFLNGCGKDSVVNHFFSITVCTILLNHYNTHLEDPILYEAVTFMNHAIVLLSTTIVNFSSKGRSRLVYFQKILQNRNSSTFVCI